MMAADAQKAATPRRRRSTRRRRDHRQPADPGGERGRGPQDDGARVRQGVRPGQGAVSQNSRPPAEARREEQLLSQLDQAKMQEELNSAMAPLSETVGDDVPTLNEVQQKIEARYAKAKAPPSCSGAGSSQILEVEQATANIEAQSRLSSCAPSRTRPPPTAAASRQRADRPRPAADQPPPATESGSGATSVNPRPTSPLSQGPGQSGSTTRSSRWMTSWTTPSGRSRVCMPATCGACRRRRAPCPGRRRLRRCRGRRRRRRRRSGPRRTETPAGSSDVLRSTRARRAPSSTTMAPPTWAAKAIHSLRAGAAAVGWKRVPTGSPATASTSTSDRRRRRSPCGTPDHDAIRAASSLLAMPPLPRPLPPRPARIDSSGSSTGTSLDESGRRRRAADRR